MRRVLVQRWPAVPDGAEQDCARGEIEIGAGATMMALLPPSSRMVLPKRRPTDSATRTPILLGARGRDEGNTRVVEQPLADRRAVANNQ